MNVASLPHVVTIINPTSAVDRYGDAVEDYGDAADHLEAVPAWVQRQSASEAYQSGRDVTPTTWLLVLPVAWITGDPAALEPVTIGARSRVVYDGDTYEVDGDPNRTTSTRGPHHWEATLKSVGG